MQTTMGVHEDAKPAETALKFPGHTATRDFTSNVIRAQDLVRLVVAACTDSWDAGQTAVWSFKPHPDDVASGAWKPFVKALAKFLKGNPGKKTIVVIWHEPENDQPKWFKTPEDFVRLFNQVHDWLMSVWSDLVTCHAALAYKYGIVKGGISDAEAPRWKTKAKLNAIDAYSGRTWPVDRILPEHPGFVRWKKYVAGDVWAATERGFAADPDEYELRAATVRRETVWLVANRPVLLLIWATGGSENDPKLLADPQYEAAIAEQFAALSLPFGYEPGPIPGVLVHSATGLLVMADRTDALDSFTSGR